MQIDSNRQVEVPVEFVVEDECIYLVNARKADSRLDVTSDAFSAVAEVMAAAARRLGGTWCAAGIPPRAKLIFLEITEERP